VTHHARVGSARRALFLDFDGTYAHHGSVPPAHADAVAQARSRGHVVFLCTGRPLSLLPDDVRSAGFDGYVATAGAYVECEGEVLLDLRFSADLVARSMRLLDDNGTLYIMETPTATYTRPGVVDAMIEHAAGLGSQEAADGIHRILDALTVVDDLSAVRPSKITSFAGHVPLPSLAALIGPEVDAIPSSLKDLGPGAGEMFLTGVNKATGIAPAIAHVGLSRDDVVACGDGPNDLEMLQFAGTSVVIEGSAPELLATADVVAAGPHKAGLVEAFGRLGLIERD
jgi:Cof subfamily protein (haloacid dehalogenase superfamily)